MEAEQNGRARNKLLATREDFSAVISPQTFQKFKSMKRVSNSSKSADSQKSTADGSGPQTSSENGDYILKVTSEEYDQLKKRYTKNKRAVKQKPAEQQLSRSKSKSPSTLKLREKVEEANKQGKSSIEDANKQERSPRNSGIGLKQNGKDIQERSPRNSGVGLKLNGKDKEERSPRNSGIGLKQNGKDNQERSPRNSGVGLKQNGKDNHERSPRNSGVGLKQNGKAAQKKLTENTSPAASKNNLKSENKPASRKSYDVADSKTKTETNDNSRWSVGMASGKSLDDGDGLLDASLLKGKQSDNSKLGEPSDMLDNSQEKKGRKKTSPLPKSPNKQGNKQKKDNIKKRNSIEKENKNKTRKSSTSKDHSSLNKDDDIRVESDEYLKNNRGEENLLKSEKPELEKDVEVITNQIKQLKIEDNTQNLTNKVCETGTQPKYIKKTGGNSRENKKILSNDSGLKLNDSEGPTILEDEKKASSMNVKKVSDSEDRLIEVGGKQNSGIEGKVADFRFVTKRMDESLAADIQLPSVDLDGCLENTLIKSDVKDTNGKDTNGRDTNGKDTNVKDTNEKDTNDNNFSSVKYQPMPGTSKSSEVSLEENLQTSLSTAIKLAKKTTPTARTPIILKTPKRLKDGEIMSEMLIYKLGSHSTPRKIRKNRNLDSFRRSDWGTPATDRITSSIQTRKISKKVKGKIFIKKTSKGALQPLPISKLVPKLNSPRRGQSPNKSAKDKSGDETYKVVPVSDLIKKFENLEKVEEPAVTQSNKVAVTFKKNAIFEKWQNGAKAIQGLVKLKEVEKKSPAKEVSNNETPIKISEQKTNSENKKETTPTSKTDSTNNNGNFNSLTILNSDCIDTMSFVSLKFEQIYSDECNDQSGKNLRFSDLYKEINFQLSDNEKIEVGENTNEENPKVEEMTKINTEYSEPTQQDTNNADKTIISNNEQGQVRAFEEEGTDVLETLDGGNFVNDKNYKGEAQVQQPNQLTKDKEEVKHSKDVKIVEHTIQPTKDVQIEENAIQPIKDVKIVDGMFQDSKDVKIIVEHAIQPTNEAQILDGFQGFEEVIVAEGRIDTTGEDRASPAYEAVIVDDVIKEEEQFGDSFRQQLLSMESHEDDDDTSISTLLALSQKVSKQPMSYADYRKQFMAVKSRSLPPQPKINRCDTDDPKMSL